jgi:hypothetical protein
VSELRPGEVRVFQRKRDGRWAVGVDAPELDGELRVATERDATPVARFVSQALDALRGAEALVLTRGEFAAVRTVRAAIQAAAAEQFGDAIRSAADDVMAARLAEVEAEVRAHEQYRIRLLVGRWRTAAESLAGSNALWSSHFYDCANELDRLLKEEA